MRAHTHTGTQNKQRRINRFTVEVAVVASKILEKKVNKIRLMPLVLLPSLLLLVRVRVVVIVVVVVVVIVVK